MTAEFAPSLLQSITLPELDRAGVQLYLKRDDLIDPYLGGNKWRKLKHNLRCAQQSGATSLLTFGGAYSNHIYAVAAAGQRFGLKTVGVIRGEPSSASNPTLAFAQASGMHLHFVDRERYRHKTHIDALRQLGELFGPHYLLPEGGSNALALPGCAEIVAELDDQLPSGYDVVVVPVGSGGTLAGVASGLANRRVETLGFAILKGGAGNDGLAASVERLLNEAYSVAGPWRIEHAYHCGGYARCDDDLFAFISNFHVATQVQLDPIYNGKMMYGLFDQIRQGAFARGTTLVALHTGGLQGWAGISNKYKLHKGL